MTQKQNEALQQDVTAYMGQDGTLQSVESLMKAAGAYLTDAEDVITVMDYLQEVEELKAEEGNENSEAFDTLYNTLLALIGPQVAESYDKDGHDAFWAGNYADAIPNLEKAFLYDATNGQALFDLANSYNHIGEKEKAKEIYRQVIDLFPNTEKADKSEKFLAELEDAEE